MLSFFLCVCVESVGLRSKVLRKVEELKGESVCSGIPDEFLCPITRELMREPVIAAGEQTLVHFSIIYTQLHKLESAHWVGCEVTFFYL